MEWKRKLGMLFVILMTVSGCTGEKPNPDKIGSLEWTFKTNGRITSSPVQFAGAVYIGSDDGNLYAVEEKTGKLKWKFAAGGFVRSTAKIAFDTVYFLSHNGIFYAIDAATGHARWSFDTGSGITEMDEWDYYDSSPEISGETVYFGSSDKHLYALDARTGAKRWSCPTAAAVKSSPTADGQSVYFGDWSGYVYAVHQQTGQLAWKFKTEGNGRHVAIQAKPAVSGDTLYVGARDFNLYALDKSSGRVIWKQSKPAWVASPVVWNGTIYVGNSNGYSMEAVDAGTGRQQWIYSTSSNVLAAPAVQDGVLYFGSGEAYSFAHAAAYLYAVEMKTGKEIGKRRTEKIQSTPLVHGDTVFYSSFDGNLYAVSRKF